MTNELRRVKRAGDAWETVSEDEGGGGGSQPVFGVPTGAVILCVGHREISPGNIDVIGGDLFAQGYLGAGFDAMYPWFIPAPLTLAHLFWTTAGFVGGTHVGKYRLAIYEADESWQPSALAWDSGQQDAATVGTTTVAAALTLQGRYLSCWCIDAAAEANGALFVVPIMGAHLFNLNVGFDPAIAVAGGGDGPIVGFKRTRAFGAFPDPGSPWTVFLNGLSGGADPTGLPPLFGMVT